MLVVTWVNFHPGAMIQLINLYLVLFDSGLIVFESKADLNAICHILQHKKKYMDTHQYESNWSTKWSLLEPVPGT